MTAKDEALARLANPETKVFWEAAARGRLLLPKCTSCGRVHWYPRRVCPHCASTAIEMQEANGTGEIYSYSIMRRAKVPYAIAFVRLSEGATMMTNIVDCDFNDIQIGMLVKLVFRDSPEGYPLPTFTKA
jgi:uncharacterized OB-fold protein